MIRISGYLKVITVIFIDFIVFYSLSDSMAAALGISGLIALYVWLGGYLALRKEGAIIMSKLPYGDRYRLETAKTQLCADIKRESNVDLSRLRLYLVPHDEGLQATAYGANCISVSQGTLHFADPLQLNAVLAHEASHLLHCDPAFNRAVFCSITLLIGSLSLFSAVTLFIVFLLFALFNCFRSWLGVLVYQGTSKVVSGMFAMLQRAIVSIYRLLFMCISRHAEYRSDGYACDLGYGLQLAHFLSVAAPEAQGCQSLREALYRSHPPTPQRIARLEARMQRALII